MSDWVSLERKLAEAIARAEKAEARAEGLNASLVEWMAKFYNVDKWWADERKETKGIILAARALADRLGEALERFERGGVLKDPKARAALAEWKAAQP